MKWLFKLFVHSYISRKKARQSFNKVIHTKLRTLDYSEKIMIYTFRLSRYNSACIQTKKRYNLDIVMIRTA